MAEPRLREPGRADAPGRWSIPGPAAAMAGVALLVVLASAARLGWSLNPRFDPLPTVPQATPSAPPAASANGFEPLPEATPLPGVAAVFWTLVTLAVVVAVLLLARHLWRIRPRRRVQVVTPAPPPAGTVSIEEQTAALRRGALSALELLDEIPDPQDAVVRAWLALEQAAESSGAARRPADSPTEFVRALLVSTGADRAASTQLLALYHRARFSGHPVGLPEVRQARTCVAALARSLDGYESALRRSVAPPRTDGGGRR